MCSRCLVGHTAQYTQWAMASPPPNPVTSEPAQQNPPPWSSPRKQLLMGFTLKTAELDGCGCPSSTRWLEDTLARRLCHLRNLLWSSVGCWDSLPTWCLSSSVATQNSFLLHSRPIVSEGNPEPRGVYCSMATITRSVAICSHPHPFYG